MCSFGGVVRLALSVLWLVTLGSCGSSSSSSVSPETALMSAVATSMNTTGTSSSGVLSGTGSTATGSRAGDRTLPNSFSTAAVCNHSGDVSTSLFASNVTPGWAIARIFCNFAMRPDGPDTVRGGVDRTAGFICAIGNNLTYDGQAHTVPITIDSNCFSPAFITMACTGATTCSGSISVVAYTAAQYTAAGYTAPTGFNKILALSLSRDSDGLYNTVAISDDTAGVRAAAINYALPDGSQNKESVFAVYLNSTTGQLRYEGRFAGNSSYVFRHLRAQATGTIDASAFTLSGITGLQFIEADNFQTQTGSAYYLSLSGSAASGRVIGYGQNTYSSSWGSWSTTGDNAVCYPNTASCGAPLAPSGSDMTFATEGASAASWFTNNSFLNSTATTVPLTDLWQ